MAGNQQRDEERESKTYTCVHGRTLPWKFARLIVEERIPWDILEEAKKQKLCLYDYLLKGES